MGAYDHGNISAIAERRKTRRILVGPVPVGDGAPVAGVNTSAIIIGVFSVAGALAALGGVMLSYSLEAASATQLSDTLVAAASAALRTFSRARRSE